MATSTKNPRLPTRRDQGKALARKESSGGGANLAALARVAAESRPSPATRKTYADVYDRFLYFLVAGLGRAPLGEDLTLERLLAFRNWRESTGGRSGTRGCARDPAP